MFDCLFHLDVPLFLFFLFMCVSFVFDDAKVYIIFGLCKKIEEYFGTFLSTPYYKSRVRMRVDVFSPFLRLDNLVF